MFRTGLLSIITSLVLYTRQKVLCHTGYADCASEVRIHPDPAISQHSLYDKYLLPCIQYKTRDDGQ